ncbi:MAG: iron uptake porin [Coleofasciculus sp.]
MYWQSLHRVPASMSAVILLLSLTVPGQSHPLHTQGIWTSTTGDTQQVTNLLAQLEPNNLSQQQPEPLEPVNFVNELSDIRPNDWAIQAVQNLAERYGCLLAYPNGTYRGRQVISRYEFAASLNECLERIQEIGTTINAEDLARLRRLQEEFARELAHLNRRVDALAVRRDQRETNQFSTTSKLQGETSLFFTGVMGDEKADGSGEDVEDNSVFQYRTRLILNTSFTGRDLLKTFLVAGNSTALGADVTGTNMTRLAFDLNTNNDVRLGKMFYRFPISENLNLNIDAVGGGFNANMPTFNEFFTPEITGALSRFGRFNPIYRQGLGGAGATLSYNLNDATSLSLAYLAPDAGLARSGNGLFNGRLAGLAQLGIEPTDNLRLGLTYVRSYYPGGKVSVSGEMGSRLANQPFGQTVTSANHLGVQTAWRVSPNLTLGSWAGLTFAQAEDYGMDVNQGDDATIFNWAFTLAASNLDSKGSRAGIVVGQPPKVTHNDGGDEDGDTAWHFEGFYRYQLTDGIGIEPGFLVIVNPEHNADNSTSWLVNIRTIFLF